MSQERSFQGVNEQEVTEAVQSDEFIHAEKDLEGIPIYTFRYPGEKVEGRLYAHSKQSTAYKYKTARLEFYHPTTGKKTQIAFRLSGFLGGCIRRNHLWGEYIRITYKGSRKTGFGHAQKIYLVEVDKGCITENFEGVKNGKHKSSKPRANRKIRRPLTAGKVA